MNDHSGFFSLKKRKQKKRKSKKSETMFEWFYQMYDYLFGKPEQLLITYDPFILQDAKPIFKKKSYADAVKRK